MQKASVRVVLNTGIQYVRTFITVCIALYSSRVILQQLGDSDFGIYSLIASVVALLSFINTSLSSTTQRYLSFQQGKQNSDMQLKVFNNSFFVLLIIGLFLAVVLISLTVPVFSYLVDIPVDRLPAAKIVYCCVIGTVFFTMLSVPYTAVLIANENILYFSIVQIVDAVLKLGIAISLFYVCTDKLVYYAMMVFVLNVLNLFLYMFYCRKKYAECRCVSLKIFDVCLFREMFSFSGWLVYSTGCIVARTQGISILLNRFFGTVMNAAYGIAMQLGGNIIFISSSLLNAIRPQIIRAEGENNRLKMLRLSEMASKFSFFLLSMLVVPTIFEMEKILSLWLGNYPKDAVMFCQFIIAASLVDQLTIGLGYANQAIGNIKIYSLVINTVKLLTLPVATLCLIFKFPVVSVMACYVAVEFICSVMRLFLLRKSGGLSIRGYFQRVFVYEFFPVIITISVCGLCHSYLPWYFTYLGTFFVMSVTVWLIGLCDDERVFFKDMIHDVLHKCAM